MERDRLREDGHPDVVVVGGGISGLATAWHLRDREVVVLEASDRLGGRIRSVPREDTWLTLGAHVLGAPGTATDRLFYGLGLEALPLPGKLASLAYRGRLYKSSVETYPFLLPISLRSRLALVRAGLRLRWDVARYSRVQRQLSGESPAERQARVLSFMDDISFTDHMGTLPPDVDALFNCTLTRSAGEPNELAAGYGVGYFHLIWDRGEGLSRAMPGGPEVIIERLSSMLSDVRTGSRVKSVEQQGEGVRVVYEDGEGKHEITAAAAVVASQAPVTAEIVRGLPDETEQALREVHYGPYAIGGILVNRKTPLPWDQLYAIATPGRSFAMAYNIGNVQLQPGAESPKYGSIMVYTAADAGARLMQEDDETIARTYRDDLAAVFPEVSGQIEDVMVQRVELGTPFAHVGRGRLQAALTQPLGRVHLIGDYLGTRYVDTCAERAELTASAVRAQLPTGLVAGRGLVDVAAPQVV